MTSLAFFAAMSITISSCDEKTAGEKLEEQLENKSELMEERSDDLEDASEEIDDAVDDMADAIENFKDALEEVDNLEDRDKIRERIMKIFEMHEMQFQNKQSSL